MTASSIALGQPGQRHLLLGNEAIARGALEAGVRVVSCYPGTPSSEVADTLAALETTLDRPFALEYSVNEKVALEVACGAALAGFPALATMKHVGLNVAADPLFTSAYTGLPGGLVILTADDPGCHSSQNEQDNRNYARFAHLPCFEPASVEEALQMTRAAFKMAADLEQPTMLRTTTRISHMRGEAVFGTPQNPGPAMFDRTPGRFVPVPQVARKRHLALAGQMRKAAAIAENSPFNKVFEPNGQTVLGVIASGSARPYLHDALMLSGWGDSLAILELGQTWPLPEKMLSAFMLSHPNILVLEEGEPLLERDVRAIAQKLPEMVTISGKDEELTEFGEYSTSLVLARLGRWLNRPQPKHEPQMRSLPTRPPNLCPGCAHRGVYYAARKVFGDEAIYSSDIGCYTLGLLPPLRTADFLVCMGSSVSAGSGFARASGKTVVGFIGDSTFFHSGITGLANAIHNQHDILVVILDNGTTAMTGHQPNPGMCQECLGEKATRLNIEKIIAALGINQIAKVKAANLGALLEAMRDLKDKSGVRVLIAEEPCMLHARRALKRKRERVAVVKRQDAAAQRCFQELACPAFSRVNGEMAINEALCTGCMFCLQIAPGSFGAKKIRT